MKTGKLFVLSGPSGVGKGTLREHALKNAPNLSYSISCTTRKPREGETDGVEYRFISREKFQDDISQGLFLEYAHVHEDYYGTLKADVVNELEAGRDVLLEIDVQGALQVRDKMPGAVLIFVALKSSNTDSGDAVLKPQAASMSGWKTRLRNLRSKMSMITSSLMMIWTQPVSSSGRLYYDYR